jgi:hypothetical protein
MITWREGKLLQMSDNLLLCQKFLKDRAATVTCWQAAACMSPPVPCDHTRVEMLPLSAGSPAAARHKNKLLPLFPMLSTGQKAYHRQQVASQPLHFPPTVRVCHTWLYKRSGILSTVSYHRTTFCSKDNKTWTMKNRVTDAEVYWGIGM